MAFFDDLKAGLSEVAKTVGTKSEQLVNVSKLHLKKTNLSNELKATYLEIGKKVYEEKKAGADFSEDIVQLCQKVDMGLEAIAEVEAQIEEAKESGNEATVEETEDDVNVEDVVEIVEEAVPQNSIPLRMADLDAKAKIFLEAEQDGFRVVYRRVKKVNELVINGNVYDEYEALIEVPHSLVANILGCEIEAGYDGFNSFIKVDGKIIKKKIRI